VTGHLLISFHTCPMEEPGSGFAGGMNVFLRGLLRGLSRRGIATDVLTRATGDVVEVTDPFPGVRIFHVPCGWKEPPTRPGAFACLGAFAERARALVRKERISPRVVSAHYWMSGAAARRIASAPMVFSYHTVEVRKTPRSGAEEDPLSATRKAEEARLAREAAHVVFFSEYDLERTRPLFPGLGEKGMVIAPGVDDRFRRLLPQQVARAFTGLPSTGTIFLLAAREDAGKNAEAALDAFREARERWNGELWLAVAGRSGEEGGGVRFLGSVPHEGMPVLFAAADAVVCPALYESFGLVPLEALAAGIPVLAPEGTYWGTKIREEGGGVAYAPDDPGGLAEAMLRLLSEPSLRAQMSLRGPEVAAPFTWARCTEKWAGLLESVATRRSRR
jgi:D-inositol-3-phosphate glycosyltransferase